MSVCFRVVQIHYTHDAVAGDFQDSKHIHVGRLTPWGSLNRLALVEETRQSPGGRWFMYPVIVDTYTRYYTLVFCLWVYNNVENYLDGLQLLYTLVYFLTSVLMTTIITIS